MDVKKYLRVARCHSAFCGLTVAAKFGWGTVANRNKTQLGVTSRHCYLESFEVQKVSLMHFYPLFPVGKYTYSKTSNMPAAQFKATSCYYSCVLTLL